MKTTNLYLIIVSLLLVAGCKSKTQSDFLHGEESAGVQEEIKTLLQDYVNQQYQYVTGVQREATWTRFHLTTDNGLTQAAIDEYLSSLRERKLAFTTISSKLNIDSLQVRGDSAIAYASDFVSMTTNEKDAGDTTQFIITKGSFSYVVVIVRNNDKLKIRKFRSLDQGRLQRIKSAPPVDVILTPTPPTAGAKYNYDGDAAKTYAQSYWKNGNPDYCDFSPGGGDCTNFLSQCLQKGGWTQSSDWRTKLKSACPTCKNSSCNAAECYSCSWTVAQDFKYYITHSGSGRIDGSNVGIGDVNIGDIIQYDNNQDGKIDHATIVTKIGLFGGRYVTYRNSSANDPFVDRDANSVNGTPYGWKVKGNAN